MIGQTLGHYRILEKVAAGGMGVVYLARDEQLERDVAVKVLPPGTFTDEDTRRHFRKEATALARLNHPHIETVYDFGTQDGVDFLVMEYVTGKTLADRLSGQALPEREIIELAIQISSGLEEAHDRGIVHRDLKPANIAISAKGYAKILDFGLAQLLPPVEEGSTELFSASQAAAGTLPYIPPEQLKGERVDGRADIYTLGTVLYEMATGIRAFREELASRLIDAILHQCVVPVRALNPRISAELEQIILKCVDKDPARRYQSAKEVSVDLRRLAESAPWPRTPAGIRIGSKAPKRVTAVMFIVSFLVATMAGGGYWYRARRQRARETAGFNQLIRSIAIIPFRNASPEKAYDYFGVGLADVLNAKLTNARILEIHAVPLPTDPSAWDADPASVGRKLGVDAILRGSYQIEDGRLSLRYTLVDVRRGVQVAGKDFQAPFARSIDAEHELAAQITTSLQTSVSPEQREHFTAASTQQNEAFQAYLRSSYEMEAFWRQPSSTQLSRAEQQLNEALRFDPHFTLALVSLARLHWIASFWGYAEDSRILDDAQREAKEAIELEPDSGEAYAALALIELQKVHSDDARESIRAAFVRSPNSALAYYAAGLYYLTKGLAAKSVSSFQRAQEFNPELIRREVGLAYRAQGDFLRARDQLRQDLESHPADRVTAAVLTGVLVGLDDIDGAREIERTSLAHAPSDPTVQYARALLRVREGATFSIDRWLRPYEKVYWADAGYCFDVAAVYAMARQTAPALRWLRRARELGGISYPFVSLNPLFANLRGDSRFQSFLQSTRQEWDAVNREEEKDPLIP
jgi:TolB-like protein/tRNA A-37 threonylcarbamoyl transferase component Bud32